MVLFLYLLGAQTATSAEFEALRPGKLTIPREIKKVFIDPALINDVNDKLGIKNQAIRRLRDRLNALQRFETILGPPRDIDPNIETVAVIQGDIISGGEIEEGQFTEKAVCKGGISGLAGAITAKESSQQGITFSRRGMLCKQPTLQSQLVETGLAAGLSMLGVKEFPRLDEVIRVYKYKNFSLFAQVNLSLTQVGRERETLAIRSDAASFSRHVINPDSYRNIRESGDEALIIWLWFRFSPIAPVINKDIGIVSPTNPGSPSGKWYERYAPAPSDIPVEERFQIVSRLLDKTLTEFIQTISPYKVTVSIDVASGGNVDAKKQLENSKFDSVKEILKNAETPADLYNLGLAYEANARTPQDFEDAMFYYTQAFDKAPGEKLFAQGIGRMEFRLKAANKLKRQSSN
jgi:hypothetical protein